MDKQHMTSEQTSTQTHPPQKTKADFRTGTGKNVARQDLEASKTTEEITEVRNSSLHMAPQNTRGGTLESTPSPHSPGQPLNVPELRKNKNDIVETVLGFALLNALNFFWFSGDLGFLHTPFHPYLVVILPIAARYGFRGGMLSGFIAAILYFGFRIYNSTDPSVLDYVQVEFWGMPTVFAVTGIVLGEIRESQKTRYKQLFVEKSDLEISCSHLSEQFGVLSKAKREIDTRIISQEQTLNTLHEAAQALRTLKLGAIYPAVLNMLADYLHVQKATIYMLKEDGLLHLIESFGHDGDALPDTIPPGQGMAGQCFASGKTRTLPMELHQGQLPDAQILMSAPIVKPSNNTVAGVLNVEKMPFLKFNPETIKMVALMADWCGASIDNAIIYEDTKEKLIADEITGAFTPEYLHYRLKEEFDRAKRYHTTMSIVYLEIIDFKDFSTSTKRDVLMVLSLVLKNLLRNVDLLFLHGKPGKFILMLPSTPADGAQVVVDKVVKELDAFKFKPYGDEDDRELAVRSGIIEYGPNLKNSEEMIQLAERRANDEG